MKSFIILAIAFACIAAAHAQADVIKTLTESLSKVFDPVKDLFPKLTDVFQKMVKMVVTIASDVSGKLLKAFTDALKAVDIQKLFSDFIKTLTDAFEKVAKDLPDQLKEVLEPVIKAMTGFIETIGGLLPDLSKVIPKLG